MRQLVPPDAPHTADASPAWPMTPPEVAGSEAGAAAAVALGAAAAAAAAAVAGAAAAASAPYPAASPLPLLEDGSPRVTSHTRTPGSRRSGSRPTATCCVCTRFHEVAVQFRLRRAFGTNSHRLLVGGAWPPVRAAAGVQSCSTTRPEAVPAANIQGWVASGHHAMQFTGTSNGTLLSSVISSAAKE